MPWTPRTLPMTSRSGSGQCLPVTLDDLADRLRRMRAGLHPAVVLGELDLDFLLLALVDGSEGSEDREELPVAGPQLVGDDDAVVGILVSAHAGESDRGCHFVFVS